MGDRYARVRQCMAAISQLPALPALVLDLLRKLDREDVEIEELVNIIYTDKVLTSMAIRMANSPLFAQRREIKSIKHAIMVLGLSRLKVLVLSCSLIQLFPRRGQFLNPVLLWEHALACALVAKATAERLDYPDRERAYLAGLLHDLGSVAIAAYLLGAFDQVVALMHEESTDLCSAESKAMGVTHCEFGYWIAKKWNLPADLTEAIACHHNPGSARVNPVLTAIASLADIICDKRGLAYVPFYHPERPLLEEPCLKLLKEHDLAIRKRDLESLVAELEEKVTEVRELVRLFFTNLPVN